MAATYPQSAGQISISAHRLATVRDVDEILVMEEGRLVEHGSYTKLKDAQGAFAELLQEQRLGDEEEGM